uniref:Reverse transcriptase domain-containing protein n=1 Tax=Tanacetum cinerariifolium TaxID=118510 RepID=A0A6L2L1F5_TANCI|nr:reverse transcriptase domain-containing protein [Tanacetum cinerariifolium]
MRTRSSSNLVGESSPNPTTLNTKCRNHRRSKQPFSLEESPLYTMAVQRTMAKLLHVPTKGYAEEIMVPRILAEHFKLKHSLINMMTSNQFCRLEKDNPHDHIRWFNKITSTIKYKDVPKLMLFPFSLTGAARRWLKKEPPRSILTWEDLVSKFVNEFFPPSRTTNLRNEISNFQQRFDESFHKAWDPYKDLLCACPHHDFTELHQLDTFYNALNSADQDSLNSAAGGNLLERRTQELLMIIENKSKQTSDVTTAMTAILKQFQATPPPAFVKAIEEICVTCGVAAVNYNQGNSSYHPLSMVNQIQPPVVPLSELEKIIKINKVNIKAMQAQINNVKNELINEMQTSIQASMSNQTNELKNMMASFFQMNTASSSGSGPLRSNTIANPKEEDECAEETLKDPELAEYTIKVPPPLVQKAKPPSLRTYVVHQRDPRLPELISTRMTLELANRSICTPAGIARDVFVPVGKFTFPTDFVIVDYESDPRVPLILGRPFLRTTRALIDVHEEEMILRDDLFSKNPLCGNNTSSSPNHLLEEFADELALITFSLRNDDLLYDIESDLREIEYLLNHVPTKEMDSILEDSTDECNPAYPNNDLVDTIPEMFTDEHTLNYSSPPLYDDVDDDLVELEFDNDDVYDDLFDSKEDKIKESKLLIDELNPPRSSDFLPSPECDSVLYEDFSEVDALPSTNNKDTVFNLGILIHEGLFEVTIRVTPDKNVKKISISNASLILEDFNPPLYELPFHKEVLGSEILLSFSSENKEKVFNPEILTSKGVHTSLLSKLSHRGPKAFKVIKIFESPMEIFPCSYREDIHILDFLCLYFYPS